MENGGAPFEYEDEYDDKSRAAIDVGRLINARSARNEGKTRERGNGTGCDEINETTSSDLLSYLRRNGVPTSL